MAKQILSTAIALVLFFILLFFYTKLAGPLPFSVNSVTTTKSKTFDVTADGKASIKPDTGSVSAGVTANGQTQQQVQDQMNAIINKVSVAVKNLGIDSSDIQTTNYSINPSYDYSNPGTQKINGYTANTNLTIKVRDISKINSVIDAATSVGATNVQSYGLTNSDSSGADNQARQIAIANAKKKARQIATMAGFHLGRLINYSEGTPSSPRPLSVSANSLVAGGADFNKTTIEPGTNEVSVTVTLSYDVQ